MQKNDRTTEDTSGVHVWLVLWKTFRALATHAERSLSRTGLGDSDFRVLEVLLHKGPLPVNTIGPKVGLTAGSISVGIDRLVKKALVTRESVEHDRRVRIVELTEKGRKLISKIFAEHAAAMEEAASALSKEERTILMGLLKKLGKAPKPD
jgi:MarR family 2-MHQ and catechol resistance regulon transcriptional repressor